jgi:hypothetical protein
VKRFFVSEARRAELENLTEARQSGAPGDFSGASFWYFLRGKVLRVFMNLIAFSRNIKPNSIPYRGSATIPQGAPPLGPGSFFCSPKRTEPRKRRFPSSFNRHTPISLVMVNSVRNTKNQQLPGLRPLDGPQSLRRKMQRKHNDTTAVFQGIAPLEKSQCSDEGRG